MPALYCLSCLQCAQQRQSRRDSPQLVTEAALEQRVPEPGELAVANEREPADGESLRDEQDRVADHEVLMSAGELMRGSLARVQGHRRFVEAAPPRQAEPQREVLRNGERRD